jgi:phenylacetate-coenzyme A ligase PaaK-like adenylate-forming protein
MVDHAYRTVAMYRERYDEVGYEPGAIRSLDDLAHLPVLTKQHLLAEPGGRRLSSAVRAERLLPSVTSGTSGEILTMWHDAGRLGSIGLALVRLARMVYPYRPWHRTLYVYTSRYPIHSVFGLYPLEFIPTTAKVEQIASVWRRAEPEVVRIYPSRLRDLVQEGLGLPSPRLVTVNSESSTASERASWEMALGAPVRDQYGTEELGIVAAECRERARHVFTDLCWVEVLRDDGTPAAPGEIGSLVGTCLTNWATPVIRYSQGDRVSLAPSVCRCGRTLPVMGTLEGRARTELRTPDGIPVSSGVVIDALYGLLLEARLPLRGYKLVDGRPIELLLAPSRELSPSELDLATAHMRRTAGLEVRPRIVEAIPMGPGGKREVVVSAARIRGQNPVDLQ